MTSKLGEWLRGELDRRRLSRRDLTVRAGMTDSPVGQIARGNVRPAADSVVKIAEGLGGDPVPLLRSEGMLPDPGPETTDEEEAMRILRGLPFRLRQMVVWILRAIRGVWSLGMSRVLFEGKSVCFVRP
jgi:transcriptional regulator with XRE-family HTH domain